MRRLSDIDLRLLRIFAAVVDCNGFGKAQIALNMAQSTLSGHVAALEARLGGRLCERGRGGFRLTPAGEETYRAAQDLFRAGEAFEARMRRAHGREQARLRLGLIDTVASFGELALPQALAAFAAARPEVFVDVEIAPPEALQRALVEGRRDIVVSLAFQAGATVFQRELATEDHRLYCGRAHPWFTRADGEIGFEDLRTARFSVRAYRYFDDTYKLGGVRPSASVSNMEAQEMLILSGAFVGFLPTHQGEPLELTGRIRMVKPREWRLRSRFVVAWTPEPDPLALKRDFAARLTDAAAGARSLRSDFPASLDGGPKVEPSDRAAPARRSRADEAGTVASGRRESLADDAESERI